MEKFQFFQVKKANWQFYIVIKINNQGILYHK